MLYLLPALATFLLLELFARYDDPALVNQIIHVCFWVWVWPLAVGLAKRLHDCGHSALWALVVLVPYVGVVIFVVIAFIAAGEADSNKYGHPPFELRDAPQ